MIPIRYYALMKPVMYGGKTPKFQIVKEFGFYEPMEALRGKSGKVAFYLLDSHEAGSTKDNAPAKKLQAVRNSLNLSGLKQYFAEGGLISEYCYGNPPTTETFGGKKPKPNPFFEYRGDGFLFVIGVDNEKLKAAESPKAYVPEFIELIVCKAAKELISAFAESAAKGCLSTTLENLRKEAQEVG